MMNKCLKILKNQSKVKLLFKNQFLFSQKVYQKLTISLLGSSNFTLFLDTHDTCQILMNHLKNVYPETKFILTDQFINKIGAPIEQTDRQKHNQLKNQEVFQLLLNNNLLIYQEKDNMFRLSYGIIINQFNLTSNRNLPEPIAQNIIQLSEQWSTDKPIELALSKKESINHLIKKQIELQRDLFLQQCKNSYSNYLSLCKFNKQKNIYSNRMRKIVANLTALMTVNWIFLFAVTYGKYGWDVGQPLSYLTMLGVDLIAMMKIFRADQVIQSAGEQQFKEVSKIMNLEAQIKMRQFHLSYMRRKF